MKSLFFLLSLLIFSACSTTEETTKQSTHEVYVFDDTSAKNVITETPSPASIKETAKTNKSMTFIVQLAALSTEDRADKYLEENKNLLNYELIKKFNDKTKYFVIQLPAFKTREEAEAVRNELWKIDKFKDAFIVP